MKALSADLIIAKNQLYTDEPWIILFEIQIDDASYLRLAAYPERIIWNNHEFISFPAAVESIGEESSGRRGSVVVSVANIDRMVSAYVENNDLLGRNVSIYVISKEFPNIVDDVPTFTFRINRIEIKSDVATFELGHEDLFALPLGQQRYVRDKCRFIYRDCHCRYPSDDFAELTSCDFLHGADGLKGRGWYLKNGTYASAVEVKRATGAREGELWITVPTGTTCSGVNAPFLYKTFTGDFDAYVRVTGGASQFCCGLFKAETTSNPSSWVGIGVDQDGSSQYTVAKYSPSGAVTRYGLCAYLPYWRMTRVVNTITLYGLTDWGTEWTQLAQFRDTPLGKTINLGMALEAFNDPSSSDSFTWGEFVMTSGGLATCDYSLDGPNGCRVHNNTINFGGFPSIPYGRLYD